MDSTKNEYTISRGIKGSTILSSLSEFHPINNTCIDYMHTVLLGVIKSFFRCWFSSDFSYTQDDCGKRKQSACSLRHYMKQIDKKLLNIKPPSFVPAAPRSIETWTHWRAHEFFHFITYYSLGVFHEIMEYDYFEHLVLFVIIMENLFKSSISKNTLNLLQEMIVKFVMMIEQLYPQRLMVSGVHELLHLVKCTSDFGPLNSCCCFPFEELNRKILSLINGHDLIGEEFIKLFIASQNLSIYANESNNSIFREFITDHSSLKTSNLKRSVKINQVKITGKSFITENKEISALINEYDGLNLKAMEFTNSVSYNGIKFTTIDNNSKFCDYCIYTPEVERT